MAGTKAHLSKLFRSTDGGTTYVLVAGVTQVSKPSPTKADIDMTDLVSPAKETEKDVPDYGTRSYAFNYDGTNQVHQDLIVSEVSGSTDKYKVELPDKGAATVTSFEYLAIVESVDVDASVGSKQAGTINLRVTGAVETTFSAVAEA